MSDIPALWINGGILVLTGVMALVAFVQARAAFQDAGKAEKARKKAVLAQEASATALADANRIASEARDLLQHQDARATERHHVEWHPQWENETGKWWLVNVGQDPAMDVRLATNASVVGQATQDEDEVPAGHGVWIELPDRFRSGNIPIVKWRVEWKTPLGTEFFDEGRWPQN